MPAELTGFEYGSTHEAAQSPRLTVGTIGNDRALGRSEQIIEMGAISRASQRLAALGMLSARLVAVAPRPNRYWKKVRRWVAAVLSRYGCLPVSRCWTKPTATAARRRVRSIIAAPKR